MLTSPGCQRLYLVSYYHNNLECLLCIRNFSIVHQKNPRQFVLFHKLSSLEFQH